MIKFTTKENFLRSMGELYDKLAASVDALEKCMEVLDGPLPVRKAVHKPFRPFRGYSRLSDIARCYEVPRNVILGVCYELEIEPVILGGHPCLPKDDVVLLTMVIARKYGNFDRWEMYN